MVKPSGLREIVNFIRHTYNLSERKSCLAIGISRRSYRYKSKKNDDELIFVLTQISEEHPGYGFWKLYHKIRNLGYGWNHKRVHRVYVALKMSIRRRIRKRLPSRIKENIQIPLRSDECWSMDFMSDSLYDGRRFRILNIADDYNRELLSMEVDTSITSARVVRGLDQLKQQGRKPQRIRVDNGPEFISKTLQLWAQENKVHIQYIQPGKPTQNSLIERLNKSCRDELLNMYVFKNLQDAEEKANQWWIEYNYNRPHEALGNISPKEYKYKMKQSII
ncbi:IS3 family transposase [Chryseobacterium sp. G0186]|uniref:IS3 family transposase n=1 Tax=Chryseobacterium sp. G0186 TaxID=2487064 RepID=UPI000F4EBC34|nr:IS3 family transposase [Chryseobacterium sp. G0186]AZA79315.1 IS3 family transposase [Chryseobacterium sp. G0186]AZA79805.1 IS3 family transposase [Chryseobacterium sp. G0186]